MKSYGCGVSGHIRCDCPNTHKKQQVGSSVFHRARTAEEEHSDPDADAGAVFGASVGFVACRQQGHCHCHSHMTSDKELLIDYHQFDKPEVVSLGDGRTVEAVGVGTVYLNMVFILK